MQEYLAPALPMGDDFTGLVYLHGSLIQSPKRLILTDADFGKAYLSDAWAARFLERMFGTHPVLFIGYSHSDVIMTYLARGLGRAREKYVLTDRPDSPTWKRLGIHAIGYELVGKSHEALPRGLQAWADLAAMGLLHHRQRVKDLVFEAAPSQIPEDMSYLELIIGSEDKVGFFTEHARGPEWLSWIAARPTFQQLFSPNEQHSRGNWELACWFVEHYIKVESLSSQALTTVRDQGGRLGVDLWQALGGELQGTARFSTWLRPWLVLLCQSQPDGNRNWLDYIMHSLSWSEDPETALLLFRHLTEPRAKVASSVFVKTGLEIYLTGDDYWLRRTYKNIKPTLPTTAASLLPIADHHLTLAHLLLGSTYGANSAVERLSMARIAIEQNEPSNARRPLDFLIDVARDCLEELLDAGGQLATSYLNIWSGSNSYILQRLAIHGWHYRKDVDAQAKLNWLQTQGWTFAVPMRHEAFRLLAAALPQVPREQADALVSQALERSSEPDHRLYETFRVLDFIRRTLPELESVRGALEKIRQHPDFGDWSSPDTPSLSTFGSPGTEPPTSVEGLHSLIQENFLEAVSMLLGHESNKTLGEDPSFDDEWDLLAENVKRWPNDGFRLLDALENGHPSIISAIIRGWSSSSISSELAEEILSRIEHLELAPILDAVTQMLASELQAQQDGANWTRMPSSRGLAAEAGKVLTADAEGNLAEGDWVSQAVNHPAGRLAEFWVAAVSNDWGADEDGWSGIPPLIASELEGILHKGGHSSFMVEAILARHLLFFFAADRQWCESHVLPLFLGDNDSQSLRAWESFLHSGRWNSELLAAGLLDGYLGILRHFPSHNDESGRRLYEHLASIAVHSEIEPLDWVSKFIRGANDEARSFWAEQVGRHLKEATPTFNEHQWERWIRSYWQQRLESVPLQMTHGEASAMAQWVFLLTTSFPEGADLALRHPCGISGDASFLENIPDGLLNQAPEEVGALVVHLLEGTPKSSHFFGLRHLAKLHERLQQSGTSKSVLDGMLEQALRLGARDTETW